MGGEVPERLEELRRLIDAGLTDLRPKGRSLSLYEAVDHVLQGTGKRIRPLLVLTTAEAFGADPAKALPAALAVEIFHNFTLVHDDIMDKSDSRRGRPTVHVEWDESIGILTGDLLLGISYELLTQLESNLIGPAIRRFHQMVVRLCEGQALDTAFEARPIVSLEEYMTMVSQKTAALLEVSLTLGGLVAGADAADLARLEEVGRHAGCAFQIQDDLLDLTAESDNWGKPVGGDLLIGKKSYLTVRALEQEQNGDGSWFTDQMAAGGVPELLVGEARPRLEEMGILSEAKKEIARHYDSAITALNKLDGRADITYVLAILKGLLKRDI